MLRVLPGYDKAFYPEIYVLYKFVIKHYKNNMCINAACKRCKCYVNGSLVDKKTKLGNQVCVFRKTCSWFTVNKLVSS